MPKVVAIYRYRLTVTAGYAGSGKQTSNLLLDNPRLQQLQKVDSEAAVIGKSVLKITIETRHLPEDAFAPTKKKGHGHVSLDASPSQEYVRYAVVSARYHALPSASSIQFSMRLAVATSPCLSHKAWTSLNWATIA
jgi:hypothetical protein